jgi:hypothetical protein
MSVTINQDIIEQAEDLGIKVTHNIKEETLLLKIEEKQKEIAEKRAEKKKAKAEVVPVKKIRIIVESRDAEDDAPDQFFGFNGQHILIQKGEEVEVTDTMYTFIKSIGKKVKKFKTIMDEDGIPRKQWYNKWESRFIVEKLD